MSKSELTVILTEPHEAQLRVLQEAKRYNVLCCGRRWGKSVLAVNKLSEPALEGYPTGYFTPTYKLLEGTFEECTIALDRLIKRKHENQFIELITGGRVEFWSLDNEMAGRSRKYKRVVIDEAAYVKNLWKAWTESVRATLTDLQGDAWFLSTPKGKNDFYKLFMRGKTGDQGWMSWQFPSETNPHLKEEELQEVKRDLPQIAWAQEYMAEFSDNVANPFGLAFIQQCTYPLSQGPAVCFGVDLAKSYDWTVIIGLDKNASVCYFDRFQKDWKQTIEAIRDLPSVPIKVDATGVGDPIVEGLQRIRNSVTAFKFNPNSKQQIMEGLAVAIQQRKITFPEGHIKDELENFEFVFTRTGVKYSAPSGFKDDCVCSLALAWDQYQTAATHGRYVWI